MKSKSLLLTLLLAILVPWAANAQKALPYSYGFEDNDLSIDGWTVQISSSYSGIASDAAHTGSYGFAFNYEEDPGYLVSPELTGTENGVNLSFYYIEASDTWGDEEFYVTYTTDATNTDPATYTQLGGIITASTAWQQYEGLLPAGVKRMAIKYMYNDTYYLYLDDFSFEEPASCPKPSGLSITYTGGTTAEVSWTSTASAWNIDVNGTVTAITENPYTLTGLSLATNYDVKVQANCGGGDVSLWSSPKSFVTDLCLPEDQCLISYELSGGYESSYYGNIGWQGASISVVDVLTSVVLAEWTLPYGEATATGTLAVCDGRDIQFVWNPYAYASYYDDYCTFTISDAAGTLIYSGTEGFTTPYDYTVACPTCPKPLELAAVPTHTTAALTWTGADDTHTVEYQTAAYSEEFFFDGFEDGFDDQGWTIYTEGEHIDGQEGWILYSDAAHSGNFGASAWSYESDALDADNWLITPQVDLQGTLKFWEKAYSSSWPDAFEVLLSTTGKAIADFTTTLRTMQASSASWNQVVIDLSSYSGQGYIAIHHVDYDQNAVFIDDFGIYGAEHPAGGWQTATTTAPAGAYNLEGLTQGTKYDVRVTPNCGGPTSNDYTFSTLGANDKIFTTEGDWNVAANWDGGIPANTDNAYIRANVTIQNGVVATAKKVTIEGTPAPTLTIKEGGQLVHSNDGVTVTMEKTITGYTATQDHYYFLAPPFDVDPTTVTGMLANEYDLYYFDFYEVGEEWQNYKVYDFNLQQGEAYLYANNTTTTLAFTGEVYGSKDNWWWYDLYFEDDNVTYPFDGWNLVGNIYTCNAYMVKENSSDVTSFYKINGTTLQACTGNVSVAPLEGVFVKTETASTHVFWNRTAPSGTPRLLNLTLSQSVNTREGNSSYDNVIISFSQVENLEKFQFNANSSMIYIPQDGKNYAVVSTENEGEMPLNFKAENNGSFTLSFSNENIEFSYLHLIDNFTGADVDLLATPSYSFEARNTDNANRFTLVFTTGSNNNAEPFAYFDGSTWIIANGDNATLQVVDMMGRIVLSGTAMNTLSTNGMAPGVYVLRLVNDNNVRTQKIVVR